MTHYWYFMISAWVVYKFRVFNYFNQLWTIDPKDNGTVIGIHKTYETAKIKTAREVKDESDTGGYDYYETRDKKGKYFVFHIIKGAFEFIFVPIEEKK